MKILNNFEKFLKYTLIADVIFSSLILFPILFFYEFLPIIERYLYKKTYPEKEVEIPSLTLNQKLTLPAVIPLSLILFSILFIPSFLYCIIKLI